MKRTIAVLCLLSAVVAFASQSERTPTDAVTKIRDEGLNRSQVNETMFWLADAYGPRRNGPPALEQAGHGAVKQLQQWGVSNVHRERWTFGKPWSLAAFHAT